MLKTLLPVKELFVILKNWNNPCLPVSLMFCAKVVYLNNCIKLSGRVTDRSFVLVVWQDLNLSYLTKIKFPFAVALSLVIR